MVCGQVGTAERRRDEADFIKPLALTLNQVDRQPAKRAII